MAEENIAVSPENSEEGPAQAPVETRVHPREIMGDALPKSKAVRAEVPVKAQDLAPQPKTASRSSPAPVIPALIEETYSERAILLRILEGTSPATIQEMLTLARRKSGVGKASDMTTRMKQVAKEALRTS